MKVLVMNGPNLNMLGEREPEIYGRRTLEDLKNDVEKAFAKSKMQIEWFQSNHEGELVDRIQQANWDSVKAIVINPGGYAHTSVVIKDALAIFSGKVIEVHLSHTVKRESFRQSKITAMSCDGIIEGFGLDSYILALHYLNSIEGH